MSLARSRSSFSEPTSLPYRRPLASVVGVVLVSLLLGAVGGLVTVPTVEAWYASLAQPKYTPPRWAFWGVLALLYAFQGVAAWLLWRAGVRRRAVRLALLLFGIQFALTLSWSPAAFGLESPVLGFVVLVPVWAAIVAAIEAAWLVDRRVSLLLVPSVLWVTFVTALNYAL